jgi:hypothetical protein
MMQVPSLQHIRKQQLLRDFSALVDQDRRDTATLLAYIAEIDRRKLYLEHAFPSMFAFCVKRFHMSEAIAAKRIRAGRAAGAFSCIFGMIERGELHLSGVHQLAAHLTEENHEEILQRAKHRSMRKIEKLIAEISPKPDVPASVRALPMRKTEDRLPMGTAQESSAHRETATESEEERNHDAHDPRSNSQGGVQARPRAMCLRRPRRSALLFHLASRVPPPNTVRKGRNARHRQHRAPLPSAQSIRSRAGVRAAFYGDASAYEIPWHRRSQGVLGSVFSLGAGGYAVFALSGSPPPHCFKQSSMRFCRSGSFGFGTVWHADAITATRSKNRSIVRNYSSAGSPSAIFFSRASPSS